MSIDTLSYYNCTLMFSIDTNIDPLIFVAVFAARGNAHPRKRAFKRMKWSFQACYEGIWPMKDDLGKKWPEGSEDAKRAGTHLAGGKRGVLYILTGDLDYDAKSLGLPSYNSASPCFSCPCNLTTMPWYELRVGSAEWINHCYDATVFLEGLCSLFSLPFISLVSVAHDWQHDKKNLGTDQYFYGSVLWLLVFQVLPSSPANNMALIQEEAKAEYQALGVQVRFQNLRLSNLPQFICVFFVATSWDEKYYS